MARKCSITGKRPLAGNKVSHAHNTTRTVQLPNVRVKRLFVPELNRIVRIKVSSAALRTISKIGFLPFLRARNLSLKDVER